MKIIDQYDKNEQTSLMVACKNGNVDMVEYLINKGADINKSDIFYNTAIDIAKYSLRNITNRFGFNDDRNEEYQRFHKFEIINFKKIIDLLEKAGAKGNDRWRNI